MFRTIIYVLSGALLLASISALAGRGSLQQFELTVVPSLWTFGVVGAAALWAFGLRGTYDFWIRAGLALLAIAFLTMLPGKTCFFLVAGLAVERASRRLHLAGLTAIAAVAMITTFQVPAFWVGLMFNGSDVAEAKSFCEGFVPELETYYERTGTYPRSLRELAVELGSVPRLVDPSAFYTRTGNRFQLSFRDPAARDLGVCYDSLVGSWRKYS